MWVVPSHHPVCVCAATQTSLKPRATVDPRWAQTHNAVNMFNALPRQYPGSFAHIPNSLHIGWSVADKNVWSAEIRPSTQQQQIQIVTAPLTAEARRLIGGLVIPTLPGI
ncbi:hypothetical protein N7474_009774 [Penicillium riverlandense]|uniref:uncharacterized protein n=1 Tax=Penicillium riverlandense TaxID=1903569 RepID=UPI00254925DB|nr:uncharacterized protein N7474_009774 [Penicillium riverlandense]KAJ5808505.1 hypothetical protein N7474_009774 [Penicillium riverlandense]